MAHRRRPLVTALALNTGALAVLLDRERRGIVAQPDVTPLWKDMPEKAGRDCRAYYRRSEKAIYVLWGAV